MAVELVERPLPKPSGEGYVEARLLEALGEARLALEFLERGLTRNAACKGISSLEGASGRVVAAGAGQAQALAKTEEERRWLESKAVPRGPHD
jgi:Archaeal PaREP1/PaREP8 family.